MPEAELWKFSRVSFLLSSFNCCISSIHYIFLLSLHFHSLICTFFSSPICFSTSKTRRRLALSPLLFVSRDISKWRRFISYFISSALARSLALPVATPFASLIFCSLRALQLVCCSLASSVGIYDKFQQHRHRRHP